MYGDGTNVPDYFCTEVEWQTAVTTYGVCGKFVYDSVNNTVRLPKITGFIEGASGVATLGDLTEAGLPNITGSYTWSTDFGVCSSGAVFSGALKAGTARGNRPGGTASGGCDLDVDASLSNSIYGNSNTVQPQAIKVLYYIVIATSTKTDIQVDIDEIATDLNGKADVDLSNINASQSAKNTIVGWGMPDYSAGVVVSNEYSTTFPCYIVATNPNYAANQTGLVLFIDNVLIKRAVTGGAEGKAFNVDCFIDAGHTVKYDGDGTIRMTVYPLKGVN